MGGGWYLHVRIYHGLLTSPPVFSLPQIPEDEGATIYEVDFSKSVSTGCIYQLPMTPLRSISAPEPDDTANPSKKNMTKSNTFMEPPPLPPKKKQSEDTVKRRFDMHRIDRVTTFCGRHQDRPPEVKKYK